MNTVRMVIMGVLFGARGKFYLIFTLLFVDFSQYKVA